MSQLDLVKLRDQILVEHNRIRVDPKSYIRLIENQMTLLKGNMLYRPDEVPIETSEGASAYLEAIEFLKKQRPIGALTYDERVAKACRDHAEDLGTNGTVSHESSDGKGVSERIEKYCEWEECCAENLDFGTKIGFDVIVSLLVDDGVPDRGHRANLFNTDIKYIGIATAVHKEYETVHVINYVGGVRELGKPFFDPNTYKYDFPKELGTSLDEPDKKDIKPVSKTKSTLQFQYDDILDSNSGVKVEKKVNLYNGKVRRTTKKVYTLDGGKQHVVEIEDY